MKIVIPVCLSTLDLIQVLNSGVRPTIEDVETYYICGENEHARIIAQEELVKLMPDDWDVVPIGYIK